MYRLVFFICAAAWPLAGAAQEHDHSPYAGLEAREIKSLSEADLDELRRGGGWGLALPAELNGVPGPAHLLDGRDEIGLDGAQLARIGDIFAAMQREARIAGERLIAAEAAIEAAFRAGSLANDELRTLIHDAERARADLRFIHLSRHLETLPLLTTAQIDRYNELRGYGGAGACEQDGPGHDHAARHRAADCGG